MNATTSSEQVRSGREPGAAEGVLSIRFLYPPGGFLYRATSPRLRIDESDVTVPGWGTHEFSMAPGQRRVEVWVPYALPRRAGIARTEVTVTGPERVALEYMAPTVTFMRGSLGEPAGQRSAGWRGVMVLNVIGGLVLLVALIAYLTT
jgi:hypothetical protein